MVLTLLPIILNPFQKGQIILSQVPALFITILLFLCEREEFIQIPLQLLYIITVLNFLHGFNIIVILNIHALILVLAVLGQFGELWFSVVFGLDVGVECGVAEV